jgi:hypothetical protein
LGGRVEPVGASFEGASIHVFDGAVNVPGLSAFARRPTVPQAPAPALEAPEGEAGGPEEAIAPEDAAADETP